MHHLLSWHSSRNSSRPTSQSSSAMYVWLPAFICLVEKTELTFIKMACNVPQLLCLHVPSQSMPVFVFPSKVSIKIKKHTDEAIWIRIAWGDNFTKPNHLKPTYVVHHLQTPYVFVTGLTSKHKPLLNQARMLSKLPLRGFITSYCNALNSVSMVCIACITDWVLSYRPWFWPQDMALWRTLTSVDGTSPPSETYWWGSTNK